MRITSGKMKVFNPKNKKMKRYLFIGIRAGEIVLQMSVVAMNILHADQLFSFHLNRLENEIDSERIICVESV